MPSVPQTVANPEQSVESPVVSASVPNPTSTPTKPVSDAKKSDAVQGPKTATTKGNGTAKQPTKAPVAQKPVSTKLLPPKTTSVASSSVKAPVKKPTPKVETPKIGLGKGVTKASVSTEDKAKPANGKKAPVKAGTKPAAKAPAKAVHKPTPVKKAPKARKERRTGGKSIRLMIFEMLNKAQDGLTEQEVREKLGYEWNMGPQGPILKAEGCCDLPRIKRAYVEGTRAAKFFLTPRGKKAVANGTVDSEKAAKSAGIEWPS